MFSGSELSFSLPIHGKSRLGVSGGDLTSGRMTRMLNCGKHGVLQQECKLYSGLWEKLPECLVGEILAKLPFSNLMRLCRVCKRWRDSILFSKNCPRCISREKLLFSFQKTSLLVYGSSSGYRWDTISLEFIPKEFILNGVVASSGTGGLLCFSTSTHGEFIVCNPLSKCYKHLQVPYGNSEASTLSTSDLPCMPRATVSGAQILAQSRRMDPSTSFLKGVLVDSYLGRFKLIVCNLLPGSGGTTLVYSSCVNKWKKVASIPQSLSSDLLHPNLQTTVTECGKRLYFYPSYDRNFPEDWIVRYDVEEGTWISFSKPRYEGPSGSSRWAAIEYNRKLLWVSSTFIWSYRYLETLKTVFQAFELQDEGSATTWLPRDCLPLSRLNDAVRPDETLECLGQGNVMFFMKGILPFSSVVSLVAEMPDTTNPASRCPQKFTVRKWPWVPNSYSRLEETYNIVDYTLTRDYLLRTRHMFTPSTAVL